MCYRKGHVQNFAKIAEPSLGYFIAKKLKKPAFLATNHYTCPPSQYLRGFQRCKNLSRDFKLILLVNLLLKFHVVFNEQISCESRHDTTIRKII